MHTANIRLRPADDADLDDINRVIDAAILTWALPERVKRLSLSSYHYAPLDLQHFAIHVALLDGRIVGVAAWDSQAHPVAPQQQGLLLHGLYVHPDFQRRGIGARLFRRAEQAVSEAQLDGLLVRAQKDAEAFYLACGMTTLPVLDGEREYARRFWKPVQTPSGATQ